ncbi:MAG: Transcriptional regulator, family [Solirubrobacterales bacterium]|nr:Transcriptional regulator, family [Solirubrobacterales bacterium]
MTDTDTNRFALRRPPERIDFEAAGPSLRSATYYTRLEQGRDRHPSVEVLDALARALMLDDAATRHLHALAVPVRTERPATTCSRLIEYRSPP